MNNSQISHGPNRVFWILFSISGVLIVLALYSWFGLALAAPLIFRDSQGYTAAQRGQIVPMLMKMAKSYAVILAVTNVLWIAAARYFLRRLRHKNGEPTQTSQVA